MRVACVLFECLLPLFKIFKKIEEPKRLLLLTSAFVLVCVAASKSNDDGYRNR